MKFEIINVDSRSDSYRVVAEVEGNKYVKIIPMGEGWMEEMSLSEVQKSDVDFELPPRKIRREQGYTKPPRVAKKFIRHHDKCEADMENCSKYEVSNFSE